MEVALLDSTGGKAFMARHIITGMNESPTYVPSTAGSITSTRPDELVWDAAIAAYNGGQYVESLTAFLRYLDPSRVPEGGIVGQKILLEHGSVRVYIEVDAQRFSIHAPFLMLPAGGRAIAMMRKALELNRHLNMCHFHLEEENLSIRYSDQLAGCHPAKLLDILTCLCVQADSTNDLFIDKFQATRIEPIEVTPWAGDKLDQAYEAAMAIVQETLDLSAYWQSKQNSRFAYFSLDMGLERLLWAIRPKGRLRSRISKIYENLNEDSKSSPQRIIEARVKLEKMVESSKDDLAKSLYDARFILPSHNHVELGWYKNALKNMMNSGTEMRQGRNYHKATTVYLHNAYEDLRRLTLPYNLESIYLAGLERAGGQSWRDASEILSKVYQEIQAYEAPPDDKPEPDYYQKALQSMEDHNSEHANRQGHDPETEEQA